MRYLSILLAVLLMAGNVYAGSVSAPDYENVVYVDGHGDVDQPPCFVKRVRLGKDGRDNSQSPATVSGVAVQWDTNSADGVTVQVCQLALGRPIAGILVTNLVTNETSDISDSNWGYMCVQGYCLASVDAAYTVPTGKSLGLILSDLYDGALEIDTADLSDDVAVMLKSSAAAGLTPIWIP